MDGRRRAIKQERSAIGFEPVAGAAPFWMRYRSAGTEYGDLHTRIVSKEKFRQDRQDAQDENQKSVHPV